MNDIIDAARQLTTNAVLTGLVTFGRLMDPRQVMEAVAGREGDARAISGWCVASEVPPDMYQALTQTEGWQAGVTTQGCRGHLFLRLTHAVGEWRHHTVLPLYGQTMRRFASALMNERIWVSLANGDTEDAAVRPMTASKCYGDWDAHTQEFSEGDVAEVIDSLLVYAGLMTRPELQQEDGGERPCRHVSVSVVTPDDLHDAGMLAAFKPVDVQPS